MDAYDTTEKEPAVYMDTARDANDNFKENYSCISAVFADVPQIEVGRADMVGRFPEKGWRLSREAHTILCVADGGGELILKNGKSYVMGAGDVIYVTPNQLYALEGMMKLLMVWTQPLHQQDRLDKADEIIGDDTEQIFTTERYCRGTVGIAGDAADDLTDEQMAKIVDDVNMQGGRVADDETNKAIIEGWRPKYLPEATQEDDQTMSIDREEDE